MSKSRNNRGDKEYSRLQELAHENRALKKQISSLRKQLARIDLDRYETVKDAIQKSYDLEEKLEGKQLLEKMKKEWSCNECARGYLEIHLYTRPDATFYYRRCNNCAHRTESQKYTPDVSGIFKEDK